MENVLTDYDAWAIALILGVAMLVTWGFGLWLGRRRRTADGKPAESKFDDASVALLSLLLAFTFSMSLGKHDERRKMVVADSNAIGDFYTCASLLKDPVRTRLQSVIRDYARFRIDLARRPPDRQTVENALVQIQQMHGQMTDLVAEAVGSGTPIAVSLTNTLNGVTSSHATRLAAVNDRLPLSIVLLLFTSGVASTLLIGREQGAAHDAELIGTLAFILLVTFAVFVTLDLNQPQRGLITVSQEPLRRLLSSMSN